MAAGLWLLDESRLCAYEAGTYNLGHVHVLAGAASWVEYGRLLDESRLVHVTTLDFLCLTAFAPFWMLNDAEARGWEQRGPGAGAEVGPMHCSAPEGMGVEVNDDDDGDDV
eukprot:1149358-Pelagomonas_calceolata.AAC.3